MKKLLLVLVFSIGMIGTPLSMAQDSEEEELEFEIVDQLEEPCTDTYSYWGWNGWMPWYYTIEVPCS